MKNIKIKVLILCSILLLNISILFCDRYDELKVLSLRPPNKLLNAVKFHINNYNNEYYISYLTEEKNIKIAKLNFKENIVEIIEEQDIYKYEKEDQIIFLNVVPFKDFVCISHLEKYSFEIILSTIQNSGELSNLNIGESELKPFFFRNKNILDVIYVDKESQNLIFKKWEPLKKRKKRIIHGDNNVNDFNVSIDHKSGNLAVIWRNNDKERNIYLSPMNKNLYGYSPIIDMVFNQAVEFPKMIMNEKSLHMLFISDYQYKYLNINLGSKFDTAEVKRVSSISNPPNIYKILYFDRFLSTNFGVFHKSNKVESNDGLDTFELGFFNDDYTKYHKYKIDVSSQEINNIQMINYGYLLYLFWLEIIEDKAVIKYSILK